MQTGLARRQHVVKSFPFHYYCALNATFEFWSIPRNVLWVWGVFCKPLGFNQISQVSVKFPVNVHGNEFVAVDLDCVTVEKKLCL